MSEIILNTIPEAIEDLKNGKVIIVVDDEDRENEGDFLSAAELVSPEVINFMTIHGRGLICTPLPEKRCDELGLDIMVYRSSDPKETAFTVSVDLLGKGVSTGISASDRAKTIAALVSPIQCIGSRSTVKNDKTEETVVTTVKKRGQPVFSIESITASLRFPIA